MPAISLIIPVYNVAQWLPLCLKSVTAQTFTDYEVILVDDGSTDESGYLCDRWAETDSRIRVLHQSNKGLSGARNAGIAIAEGEYIAFLDSDDEVAPTWLKQLHHACISTGAQMSICAVEDVNEDGSSLTPRHFTSPVKVGVFDGKSLLPYFYLPQCTYYTVAWNKLYRADLWKKLEYPLGKIYEDDAVAHRLFWECPTVACLSEPLNRYRIRSGSICHSNLRPSAFDSIDALADRYQFFLRNKAEKSLRDKALAACWRRYLYLCGQIKAAPDTALVAKLGSVQPVLRGMLPYLPTCRELGFSEKLSAARWSTMSPEKLVRL